jgi:hypothetical protein
MSHSCKLGSRLREKRNQGNISLENISKRHDQSSYKRMQDINWDKGDIKIFVWNRVIFFKRKLISIKMVENENITHYLSKN